MGGGLNKGTTSPYMNNKTGDTSAQGTMADLDFSWLTTGASNAYDFTKDLFTTPTAEEYAISNGIVKDSNGFKTLDTGDKIKLSNAANAQPSAFTQGLGVATTGLQLYGMYDSLFGSGKDLFNLQKRSLKDSIDRNHDEYENLKNNRKAVRSLFAYGNESLDKLNKKHAEEKSNSNHTYV